MKVNTQTCQVLIITAISVIDIEIDRDDINYLIF